LVEIVDFIGDIMIDDQLVLVVYAYLNVVLRYQDGISDLGTVVLSQRHRTAIRIREGNLCFA